MQNVRAKFRCNSVERFGPDSGAMRTYRFTPQYDTSIPEDQRFSKYTPSGALSLTVSNPSVEFVAGRDYYLDISSAEEE